MSSNDELNVGLVGLGRFGRLHARILNSLAGVRLACVADPDEAARSWASLSLNAGSVVGSPEEVFATTGLDAIFIVSPEQFHTDQALAALDLGIPIFMEKPLSTSLEGARSIVAKASATETFVQIGFVLRFESQHAIVREQVAAGWMGDLAVFRAKRNCSRDWFPSYGDRAHIVYETMIHDIDLLLWFTQSRARAVYAVARSTTGHINPDVVLATFQMESGAVAHLETSWLIPGQLERNVAAGDWVGTIDAEFELIGTSATARYRLLDSGLSIASDETIHNPEVALWPDVHGSIGGALRAEDEHFLESVRSGRPSTIASLDQALHGLELADAVVRSGESGAEVRF